MVMSYNILAPSYCTAEKFELTNPKYLDWEYRKKLILDEIAYYRADIICLQVNYLYMLINQYNIYIV